MTVGVFDSRIYGSLFADRAVAACFDDREQVRAMLRVEAALARAEAQYDLIPPDAARVITEAAASMDPDPDGLADTTAAGGVPVKALIDLLRRAAGSDAGAYVHFGATSQDILDTSLVLRLRSALAIIRGRLGDLVERLVELAGRHRDTVMLARTRWQAAVPTSFGLKAAGWAAPLRRHQQRLVELEPRVLVAQLGGAAGTRSVLGSAGGRVAAQLARDLELGHPPMPWHTQRDGLVELAGWLSLVTGSIAKMGCDILLLAQNEVREVRVADGGGSSTMPHKANPVAAELLLALARHNAALIGEMHDALVHAQERDGAAWSAEWLALPQMMVATGTALTHADTLVRGLAVDPGQMAANLAAMNGLALAEAAGFALARHMPRPQATRLVERAIERCRADGSNLLDRLAGMTDAAVDWDALKDPAAQIEAAGEILDEFLSGIGRRRMMQ